MKLKKSFFRSRICLEDTFLTINFTAQKIKRFKIGDLKRLIFYSSPNLLIQHQIFNE